MFSSSSTSCSSSQLVVDFSSQCMVAVGFAGDFRARAKQSFSLPSPSSSSSNLAKLRLCFTDMFSELFFQRVQMKSLKQLRVLVIEPHTLWPACYRDALYTSLFVDFQVAAVCMQPASYLSLLASGTTSGILVNLGEEESHVLAFAFGRAVLPTLQGNGEMGFYLLVVLTPFAISFSKQVWKELHVIGLQGESQWREELREVCFGKFVCSKREHTNQ